MWNKTTRAWEAFQPQEPWPAPIEREPIGWNKRYTLEETPSQGEHWNQVVVREHFEVRKAAAFNCSLFCESISLNYKRKCFQHLNCVANKLLRHHSHYLNGLHHSVRHHSLNPIMMKLVIDKWKQKSHDSIIFLLCNREWRHKRKRNNGRLAELFGCNDVRVFVGSRSVDLSSTHVM
mgnify:CR=1 FL=1